VRFSSSSRRRRWRARTAPAVAAEFDRRLLVRLIEVHVHPVKRAFDRAEAFEEAVAEAVAEMTGSAIPALREHVERQLGTVCVLRRGLTDRDLAEFWRRVREAAKVLTA